jgi:amidohydrolase
MYPELSGHEHRTSQKVENALRELDIEVTSGIGGCGVVGLLRGSKESPIVAWRSDMDALAMDDTISTPYRSRHRGIKHACGHDAHTTIGLGAAEVLSSIRDSIPGTIKFIFQPAEEALLGAIAMITDGVLDKPCPGVIFGLHCAAFPVGLVAMTDGAVLSGLTPYRISVCRKGRSWSEDFESFAEELIRSLKDQNTFAQPSSPEEYHAIREAIDAGKPEMKDFIYFREPRVVRRRKEMTISGKHYMALELGGAFHVASDKLHDRGVKVLEETLKRQPNASSFEFVCNYFPQSPPTTINSKEIVSQSRETVEAIVDKKNTYVRQRSIPWPFNVEDFAYFLKKIPGVYILLGVSNPEKGITSIAHSPDYDIDEEALIIGTNVASGILLNALNEA